MPSVLLAKHSKNPVALAGAFSHTNVEVPPDAVLLVVVIMIELLSTRGAPLSVHISVGRGIPSKLHTKINVLFTSNTAVALLVSTSGASNCEWGKHDS